MSFWKVLGLNRDSRSTEGSAQSAAPDTVRAIVDRLEKLEPERARFIASFAYILGRVAHADLEISREETQAMERIVAELGGLAPEEAILVVQIAKSQHALFGSTESFIVTREFASIASSEQKTRLLECLFAVSAADQNVSGVEESEIRRIVSELDLTQDDYIAARLLFKEHIAVLKKRS